MTSSSNNTPKMLTDFSIDTIIGSSTTSKYQDTSTDNIVQLSPSSDFYQDAKQNFDNQQVHQRKFRPKNFPCPACQMAFSNNGQLRNHVRIHTGERPFRCNHSNCNKTFTRNEELTRHKLIHTGVRPHACITCGKRFGRKDHLKKHVKTHERKRAKKRMFSSNISSKSSKLATSTRASPTTDTTIKSSTRKCSSMISSPPPNSCLTNPEFAPLKQPPVLISDNFKSTPNIPAKLTNSIVPTTTFSTTAAAPFNYQFFPTMSTSSSSTTINNIATPTTNACQLIPATQATRATTNTASAAIQQLANDCWNKWYNLIEFYQQVHYPRVDNLTNLLSRKF